MSAETGALQRSDLAAYGLHDDTQHGRRVFAHGSYFDELNDSFNTTTADDYCEDAGKSARKRVIGVLKDVKGILRELAKRPGTN